MSAEAIDTVVVGAGQSGLAVSRLLTAARREHVVLERGDVGQRWAAERWDSLRLLTPNWLSRLPAWHYRGEDPDGFMSAADFARHLRGYADDFSAPVLTGTTVHDVRAHPSGYAVRTSRGDWVARHVVVASGPHARANVPPGLERSDLPLVATTDYRNPRRLPAGGVLVVGASATGVQIAAELRLAGRHVTLAAGRHTRMPRRYRGMDAFWWLDRTGRLARPLDSTADPDLARREPSLQLAGHGPGGGRRLDLQALHSLGVQLTGRLVDVRGRHAWFADDLGSTTAAADAAMHRFLDAVDDHIERTGLTREVLPARRPAAFTPSPSPTRLDLVAAGITSIVVAAGMRPDYSWLSVPVLDSDGYVTQVRGATPAPGLYVVGQPFQHRRDSTFIDGAGHNAHDVVGHLTGQLPGGSLAAASTCPETSG